MPPHLPRMPFSRHHGHHSGLPGNPSEVLVADQLPLAQSPGKEEGGQTSVQLKAMAMNFQEVRRGLAGGGGRPGEREGRREALTSDPSPPRT